MITILDYGMGNLGSISNMFKKIGVKSIITSSLDYLEDAEKILLPGVGAFDKAMKIINEKGFRKILDKKVLNERVPILGICLGMQLFTDNSEEGKLPGLGYIRAKTIRFRLPESNSRLKVPHMGWNEVVKTNDSDLTHGIEEVSQYGDPPRFYFVHSYYVKVDNEANSILKTIYGISFDSGIQNDNIFGAQFHPEKSHKFGMKVLENFANI